jgi:hypothetical protein
MIPLPHGETPGRGGDEWRAVAKRVGIDPLAVKALYAVGLVRNQLQGAAVLEDANPFMSFVSVCAALELLGRCLGTPDPATARLRRGLGEVAGAPRAPDDAIVFRSLRALYTVEACVALRNFATHGAASISDPNAQLSIDSDLPKTSVIRVAAVVSDWWDRLVDGREPECSHLVDATLTPLHASEHAVLFVDHMLAYACSGGQIDLIQRPLILPFDLL